MRRHLLLLCTALLSVALCHGEEHAPFRLTHSALEGEPQLELRLLNHWDNPDGTIERGYAGRSIWVWDALPAGPEDGTMPDSLRRRYEDYGRTLAGLGLNGTVLNNVNASPTILSASYIYKVRALADVLRPYGVRVYLSVNFASPLTVDAPMADGTASVLATADPLDEDVRAWWRRKADELYRAIPDFGGFLVKANSEGQPGPCDYGRTHAEGANMLAEALAPHGGIVMWRAFVYSAGDADRAKQAWIEFVDLDGQFADNVILQIKNGPIDFQPREPLSPLLWAMPRTKKIIELQITQEYLGHSNHVAFLAPMWEECFAELAEGCGLTGDSAVVAACRASGIVGAAGVANIGDGAGQPAASRGAQTGFSCGNLLAEANLYAFGRMAWDPGVAARRVADDWVRRMFPMPGTAPGRNSQYDAINRNLTDLLMRSREAVVDYMMPLGLHHLFAWGHHYGPEPWCDVEGARADWMPRYYHRADAAGLGYDRTVGTGSGATAQYPEPLRSRFEDPTTCPAKYLLWFHHVPWTATLPGVGDSLAAGATLWQALGRHYQRGVDEVEAMQQHWEAVRPYVRPAVHADIARRLETQRRDALWWRDACLLYFQQFAGQPWPEGVPAPAYTLDSLMRIRLGISNYECPTPDLLDRVR